MSYCFTFIHLQVIYVDADQVVRADLKELWDLDLHGKPYAYTPFCTSREETLGMRFVFGVFWVLTSCVNVDAAEICYALRKADGANRLFSLITSFKSIPTHVMHIVYLHTGFQFWRHGYWKDHLQGKPYHISALYVVDLQKFR